MMTKKLKQDLKKLKGDDLIVCNVCGGDNIEEKIWVNPNEYIQQTDGTYYKYSYFNDKNDAGDTRWCLDCNEPCIAMLIVDWREENA